MALHSRLKLVLPLARYPGFCCCCICLRRPDAQRMTRIFRIVRKVMRNV
jgi:hypothetical protein